MFIRDLRISGLTQMLKCLFEELLQDCLATPVFTFELYQNNRFTVSISNVDTQKVSLRLSDLETNDNFEFNLGIRTIIILSSDFSISVASPTTMESWFGQRGNYEKAPATAGAEEAVSVSCTLDPEIFKSFTLIYEHINDFLKQFAYLNSSLNIISIDKSGEELQRNVFYYPSGIFKQLDDAISRLQCAHPWLKLNISSEIGNFSYNIGICYLNWQTQNACIKTYAGNTEMLYGGSLIDGILDGIIASIKALAYKENVDITITKKIVANRLMIMAQVRGKDIEYVGSTKSRIGMPKMRKEVKKLVSDHLTTYFHVNPEITQRLLSDLKPLDETA